MVNIAVRSEKKAFLQSKFKTDPKHFWRTLKYLNVMGDGSSEHMMECFNPEDLNDHFTNNIPKTNIVNTA